ncbi:hypothetical protein B0H13DRAFT_2459787 [Mycena leptocephala]|nr:hypothetical protein B0H13DRAFT_2459787 [Mycena leptocephala]
MCRRGFISGEERAKSKCVRFKVDPPKQVKQTAEEPRCNRPSLKFVRDVEQAQNGLGQTNSAVYSAPNCNIHRRRFQIFSATSERAYGEFEAFMEWIGETPSAAQKRERMDNTQNPHSPAPPPAPSASAHADWASASVETVGGLARNRAPHGVKLPLARPSQQLAVSSGGN